MMGYNDLMVKNMVYLSLVSTLTVKTRCNLGVFTVVYQ